MGQEMDYTIDSDAENQSETLLYELSTITQQTIKELSIASMLCRIENSGMVKLENEVNELKERIRFLEKEIVNIKRKRWCCWCLQEAKYQSNNKKCYCSSQCEQLDCVLLPNE